MTDNEVIAKMKYRIKTATNIAGKGVDGKAYEDMEMAIKALEEIQQYRVIGTVDECRDAMEKQKEKKPVKFDSCGNKTEEYRCAVCHEIVCRKYCDYCGQKLDWT